MFSFWIGFGVSSVPRLSSVLFASGVQEYSSEYSQDPMLAFLNHFMTYGLVQHFVQFLSQYGRSRADSWIHCRNSVNTVAHPRGVSFLCSFVLHIE
jgi:hypothetical protein